MPKKTYSASCQVYRYFNTETGECISAYYARRLPRGKVKIEVLNLAVKSRTPMEMKRKMPVPFPFQMLLATGRRLNQLFLWSRTHIRPLMKKQKDSILQQATDIVQKTPLSVKNYSTNNGLFSPPHAPAAVTKKAVKNNASMMNDTR